MKNCYTTDEIYAKLRICPNTIKLTEKFFCRSEGDLQAIRVLHPSISDKLVASGNPRLDILHPKWTGSIKKEERPVTILINSRFSIVNPFYISKEKAKGNVFKKFGVSKNSQIGKHVDGWLLHADDMFEAFANLTEKIALAFPDYRIIIRPHPSENQNFWLNLAEKYENCDCIYEGAASDWFLKADCLVHNSCTTAVEASLTGLPCFAYLPVGDNIYDAQLPNSVSERFYDLDSMIKQLKNLTRLNETIRVKTSKKARKCLMPQIIGVQDSGSSGVIFKHIQEIELQNLRIRMVVWRLYYALRTYASILKGNIFGLMKRDENLKKARLGYASQKYPGLTKKEITSLMVKYGYSNFRVNFHRSDWYSIKSK